MATAFSDHDGKCCELCLQILEHIAPEIAAIKKEQKRLADAVFQIEEFLLNPPSDKRLEMSAMLFGAFKIKT